MPKRNIIVVGGSTGSFESFKKIAAGMPADLDASIFIVWHMSAHADGILARVLDNCGPLRAIEPIDGDLIRPGTIYVSRSDHHLIIDGPRVRVTRGPKENRFRPAVDPLFRSAAYSYGSRVIGVVLSGALDDGTSGLWTIKQRGGVAVVQDPNDAEMPSMPENAIRQVHVDHTVPVSEMAWLLTRLSQQEVSDAEEVKMDDTARERTRLEIKVAAEDDVFGSRGINWGEFTPFACPECSGVMSRIMGGGRPRFRCHTGHAFSADSLLSSLTENVEESLWKAIRGVDESIMLLNHLGDHLAEANHGKLAAKFFQKAKEAETRNKVIRETVFSHERLTAESIEHGPDIESNETAPPRIDFIKSHQEQENGQGN